MKKSSFLAKLFSAFFALALAVSCDTGSGGGGGGGSNSSAKTTSVEIAIPKPQNSDISCDITPNDTTTFYYDVTISGNGRTYGPEGASGDGIIKFENVVYDTYEFKLDIYYDSTKSIKIGTQSQEQTVSENSSTVSFDLKYSDYKHIFFASDFQRLYKIFNGYNADGSLIDDDVRLSGKSIIYLTDDINIPEFTPESGFDHWAVNIAVNTTIDMKGHKITTGGANAFKFKNTGINLTFKNGTMEIYNISIRDPDSDGTTSSSGGGTKTRLTFDNVQISQKEYTIGDEVYKPLLTVSDSGTMVLTGGTTVTGGINSNAMQIGKGGICVLLGAKIMANNDDWKAVNFYDTGVSGDDTGTLALLGEWNGITATGENRVGKVNYGDTGARTCYVFFGGDSNIESVVTTIESGHKLYLAQCSAISGTAEKFTKLTDLFYGSGSCSLITLLNTSIPDGFTIIDPDTSLFELEEEYFWRANNFGSDEELTEYSIWPPQ